MATWCIRHNDVQGWQNNHECKVNVNTSIPEVLSKHILKLVSSIISKVESNHKYVVGYQETDHGKQDSSNDPDFVVKEIHLLSLNNGTVLTIDPKVVDLENLCCLHENKKVVGKSNKS